MFCAETCFHFSGIATAVCAYGVMSPTNTKGVQRSPHRLMCGVDLCANASLTHSFLLKRCICHLLIHVTKFYIVTNLRAFCNNMVHHFVFFQENGAPPHCLFGTSWCATSLGHYRSYFFECPFHKKINYARSPDSLATQIAWYNAR